MESGYSETGTGTKKGKASSFLPWALAAIFLCCSIALAVALGVQTRRLNDASRTPLASSPTVPSNGTTTVESNTTRSSDKPNAKQSSGPLKACSAEPFTFTGFNSKTAAVFDPFSAKELDAIAAFARVNLSLADSEPETMLADWIFGVEHLPTPKSAVLAYLDGSAAFPGRFARAIVYHLANTSDAKVVEYTIGPIFSFPLNATVAIKPIVIPSPFNSSEIPYMMRPVSKAEAALIDGVIAAEAEALNELFIGSYGETYADGNMWWTDSAPRGWDRTNRLTWVMFTWLTEGTYLQMIGLNALVNHTSLNSSEWAIAQWAYNGMAFDSAADLAAAYNASTIDKISYPRPNATDSSGRPVWSSMRPRGVQFAGEQRAVPVTVQQQGARYAVQGNQVAWMGFTFHVGVTLQTGMHLNDIRFDSERVMYELSLQNAQAGYSGLNPAQANSQYSDNGWGMGWARYALIPGVDCPKSATFLNEHHFVLGELVSNNGSVCVWEQPDSLPLMRHYEDLDGVGYSAGAPRTTLVVRTVATVYNYDYLISYIFHMDGSVQLQVHASGFIQAASFPTNTTAQALESEFSTRVHENVMGTLHDHFINFKVDLDVLGVQNSVTRKTIRTKAMELPYVFPSESVFKYINSTRVTSEGPGSTYTEDPKQPTLFVFTNPGSPQANNTWGVPRGWKIMTAGTGLQLVDERAPWLESMQYLKYTVAVLQRKESEYLSGYGLYDMQAAAEPLVPFDSYIDGDSLVQQDLVAFVTVGKHHIPTSEDVPVTTTPATEMGFYIRPANYFDESPATRMTRMVFEHSTPIAGYETLQVSTASFDEELCTV